MVESCILQVINQPGKFGPVEHECTRRRERKREINPKPPHGIDIFTHNSFMSLLFESVPCFTQLT